MAHWIQGLFFQPVIEITLDMDMREVSRNPLKFCERLGQFMFHGSIWLDPDSRKLVGIMEDQYGVSNLTDIEITDARIAFTKKYEERRDQIRYVFEKKDGPTWVGIWSGPLVGDGIARCLVTELPDEFFDPGSVQVALELAKIQG